MADDGPATELHEQFSDETATATPWATGQDALARAEIYWASTVRPDGRPHVTPLIGAFVDGAMYICTGPQERKARNLAVNPHCVLTTGCNALHAGLDVVVEGEAVQVSDDARLRVIAEAFESKYGSEWHFDVSDGMFHHGPGEALVFEVRPGTAFGYGRDQVYSATRWRF
jgi:nitroimidazol reductase NimA-like FMN-containing flavoprotein (pyridoxamine 5'-phosphate oxidase superfamily)